MNLRSNKTWIALGPLPTSHSLYLVIQQLLKTSRQQRSSYSSGRHMDTRILRSRQGPDKTSRTFISPVGGRAEEKRGGTLIIAKDNENTIWQ